MTKIQDGEGIKQEGTSPVASSTEDRKVDEKPQPLSTGPTYLKTVGHGMGFATRGISFRM